MSDARRDHGSERTPPRSTTATTATATETAPPSLDELRAAIDSVDDELLDALNRRARLVQSVAAWKQQHARPFYVPDRERRIIERLAVRQANEGGAFPPSALRAVWAEIMSACLSLEQRLKVAYLGPEATFTHQATRSRFGLSALYSPVATIAAVFAEVEHGRADVGVVPVENSTEGVVNHTLDVFVESPLVVQQEIVADVSHCLLTRAGSLADVKKVYSHPQALAQCRSWLAANLPGRPLIETASTALAAREARDDATAGAVASELAGRLYELRVAAARIEDLRTNVTRFLVVAPAGSPSAPPTGRDKTSILFTVADQPGGLHRALSVFADAKLNLSRIESRPSRKRPWEYVFFIDVDGHAADPALAAAIDEFRSRCAFVRVLGSYARADRPAEADQAAPAADDPEPSA